MARTRKTRIYPKKLLDTDCMTLAKSRFAYLYDEFDKVWVFFSGGKDSTVCLEMAVEAARQAGRLPVDLIHFDEECVSPETVEYVQRTADRPEVRMHWYCLPIKHRNACSYEQPWWYPWAPEARELWVRDLPPTAITELTGFDPPRTPHYETNHLTCPPEFGRQAVVMGLRSQESMNRYMAIANNKRGEWAWMSQHDSKWLTKCYPIYDLGWDDVWLAHQVNDWDHNQAYDTMRAAGIPASQSRVAPPFGEQPLQHLWKWQVCWPELWAKMCMRVAGASTAVRYSQTELYGYGSKSPKPDGMTWRDWCVHCVDRFSGEERKQLAKALQGMMAKHRRQSRRPMPDDEPDPTSGLCWRALAMVASTGDMKGRRRVAQEARANNLQGRQHVSRHNPEV